MRKGVGALREQLTIQQNAPAARTVASLTRSGTVATVTMDTAHGFTTNDFVNVSGATPTGYNLRAKITVTGAMTFTYPVSGSLATPATGSITATYVSDAQGDRLTSWATLDTIWAEMIPLKATERLQLEAMQSDLTYRFRVRRRTDLTTKMRALWTPSWPPRSAQETLEITGVLPADLQFMFLEAARSPAA